MCVCICVCVCECMWVSEKEREQGQGKRKGRCSWAWSAAVNCCNWVHMSSWLDSLHLQSATAPVSCLIFPSSPSSPSPSPPSNTLTLSIRLFISLPPQSPTRSLTPSVSYTVFFGSWFGLLHLWGPPAQGFIWAWRLKWFQKRKATVLTTLHLQWVWNPYVNCFELG